MKKFMIVCTWFDEASQNPVYSSLFTDSRVEAHNMMMDVSCGLGGRAQIYEWDNEEECYTFLLE